MGTEEWANPTVAKSGTVSPGKVADLVLLNANPFDDVQNAFRQDGVMLHGKWFPESDLQSNLARMAAVTSVDHESVRFDPRCLRSRIGTMPIAGDSWPPEVTVAISLEARAYFFTSN